MADSGRPHRNLVLWYEFIDISRINFAVASGLGRGAEGG